jgi:hypothetical protein
MEMETLSSIITVERIAAEIRALANPDNLAEFSTALTEVLGQAAVAAEIKPQTLHALVAVAYTCAESNPEAGANELMLLAIKKAAGWC